MDVLYMGMHGRAIGNTAMEPGLRSVATCSDKPKCQQADEPPQDDVHFNTVLPAAHLSWL